MPANPSGFLYYTDKVLFIVIVLLLGGLRTKSTIRASKGGSPPSWCRPAPPNYMPFTIDDRTHTGQATAQAAGNLMRVPVQHTPPPFHTPPTHAIPIGAVWMRKKEALVSLVWGYQVVKKGPAMARL